MRALAVLLSSAFLVGGIACLVWGALYPGNFNYFDISAIQVSQIHAEAQTRLLLGIGLLVGATALMTMLAVFEVPE